MNIEAIFTKDKDTLKTVIFLKDQNNQNIDGHIAIAFIKDNIEKIFLPAKDSTYYDPVYPSNKENHVYRIEKGIYHASGQFPAGIKKIMVWARTKETTASKEIIITENHI